MPDPIDASRFVRAGSGLLLPLEGPQEAIIVLEYRGRRYELKDTWDPKDGGDGYDGYDMLWKKWTEHNFSCDCNRSIVIYRQTGKLRDELDCGNKIKLVSIDGKTEDEHWHA